MAHSRWRSIGLESSSPLVPGVPPLAGVGVREAGAQGPSPSLEGPQVPSVEGPSARGSGGCERGPLTLQEVAGVFFCFYWDLSPRQQPGSYQGSVMMMMKSVFWSRKPEYPEERTPMAIMNSLRHIIRT